MTEITDAVLEILDGKPMVAIDLMSEVMRRRPGELDRSATVYKTLSPLAENGHIRCHYDGAVVWAIPTGAEFPARESEPKQESKRKFQLVSPASGDWVCLMEDGKCLAEGHSLPEQEILEVLGHEVEQIELDDDEDEEEPEWWAWHKNIEYKK